MCVCACVGVHVGEAMCARMDIQNKQVKRCRHIGDGGENWSNDSGPTTGWFPIRGYFDCWCASSIQHLDFMVDCSIFVIFWFVVLLMR